MPTVPTVTALIVAAGSGSRMGGMPKQFMSLGGRPMVSHSYERFKAHPAVSDVLLVIGEGQEEMLRSAVGEVPFVIGGSTRLKSVRNGLDWLGSHGAPKKVLIHDAARPLVPSSVIDGLLAALEHDAGAVPFMQVADTLAKGLVDGGTDGRVRLTLSGTVDRSELVRVQTPQAFDFAAILKAHRAWPQDEEATDDAQVLRRAGGAVAMIPGDPSLEKVTFPGDIPYAEARLNISMTTRTGSGFDVHAFAGSGPIMLGGVVVAYDRGLSGHSDADVALHSITDALLGAAALGDIGDHFPPSDPQWKGAASDHFLAHAASLIRARGGVIDHVDCTIICELPKVGPHRLAMRQRIADILALPLDRVSLKATTTERLGFAGRGEGIAAQAIATIRLPN